MQHQSLTRLAQMRDAYAQQEDEASQQMAAALSEAIDELAQLNDADRRAGAAERKLDAASAQISTMNAWLREAKIEAGYSPDVSFDVVWKDILGAANAQPVAPLSEPVMQPLPAVAAPSAPTPQAQPADQPIEHACTPTPAAGHKPSSPMFAAQPVTDGGNPQF